MYHNSFSLWLSYNVLYFFVLSNNMMAALQALWLVLLGASEKVYIRHWPALHHKLITSPKENSITDNKDKRNNMGIIPLNFYPKKRAGQGCLKDR